MTGRGITGRRGDEVAPLLVVGPTAPPYHGGALMTERLLAVLRDRGLLAAHLDTRDPRSLAGIGRFDARNVWLGIKHASQFAVLLARNPGARVYIPISQGRWGFVRDSVLLLSARAARRRRIVHLHGGHFHAFYRGSGLGMRALIRAALSGVDQAWVLTDGLRGMFEGLVPPDRVRVLANAVDDSGDPDEARLEGPPEAVTALRVLHVSNLLRSKGWDQLFVAAERLSSGAGVRLHLRLVGELAGTARQEIRDRAERLARAGVEVEVLGTLEGEAKLDEYRWADVFVYPSTYRFDGQPLVLLEAMAAGLPIITTSMGGIPDTLADGETAIVIAPGDAGDLVEAIERVGRDAALRRRLGAAARRRYLDHYGPASFAASVGALVDADGSGDDARAKPPPQDRPARPRPPTPPHRRSLRT